MSVFVFFFFTLSGAAASLAFEGRAGVYVAHEPGYSFSVTRDAAALNVGDCVVRISGVGASRHRRLEGLDLLPGRANYLLGRKVRASYDLYGRVRWRGIYPGVDVVFRGDDARLEYDFEIAPGGDVARIALAFDGADHSRIDAKGDLVLDARARRIVHPKPIAYQNVSGEKRTVEVEYRLDAANHVRFRVGRFDRRRLLVIDPQIDFEKTFGGSATSTSAGIARDAQGNLYLTGTTDSTDFEVVNPLQNHLATAPLLVTANAGQSWTFPSLAAASLVTSMAAAPSAPATIYAATTNGIFSSSDGGNTWTQPGGAGLPAGMVRALAVDASSATTVYATLQQGVFVSTDGGATWHASTNGLSGAGFLTIMASPTAAGTVWASVQAPAGVFRSVDSGQSWTQVAFASGQLTSPVNAIVFNSGGIVLGTGQGLLISNDGGNTWTAGANQSVEFNQALEISPASPNLVFVISPTGIARSTDGGQTFSTVLNAQFIPPAIAVDPRNPSTVYACGYNALYRSTDGGQTWSPLSLPYAVTSQTILVSPADSRLFLGASTNYDVFVTKWSADGSQILYSTYLGGSGGDGASAIAVDSSGSAYVAGFTASPDFPTTTGAFQTKLTTAQDVFIAKLSADGSQLVYSTLLGASNSRVAGIAVDSSGDAVISGSTQGVFPVTSNAFQTAPVTGCNLSLPFNVAGSGDAFVTRVAAGGNALAYSTLLGGSCATSGGGVALDASGNAWVVGSTTSPDFPVTSGALQPKFGGAVYDGFLARFDPSGGLDYATYIGGAGDDLLNAVALDASGDIYVTGESGGLAQPASAGAFQPQASASCFFLSIGPGVYEVQGNAVVVKLDPMASSIERLTYLGAPHCLSGSTIAVDSTGEPWIAGQVASIGSAPQTAIPLEIGLGQSFLSKFSADFTQLLFSTYFDFISGVVLDSSGFAYVAGMQQENTATLTQPVYVAKIDPTPQAIALNSIAPVVAPAPPQGLAIAPGEVVQLSGENMGPAQATPGVIQSGVLQTNVAGVSVTFDGVAAPLLALSSQSIELIAPFEIAGKSSTSVQVQYNGAVSNTVEMAVNAASPEILGVFNQDFSANSASNPAQPGSVMTLYVSGVGQTNPPSQDGVLNTAPLAAPGTAIQLEWFASSTGLAALLPITFAGAAPGLAAGVLQINFVAPAQSLGGIQLLIGTAAAEFNVSSSSGLLPPHL